MLSAVSLLSFPHCVSHLMASLRLDTDSDHNTPPGLAVAFFLKKIPGRLMANLMRDCVLHKVKRMFCEQTC